MPNAALREARVRAHLSQGDVARLVREWGFQSGEPNGCTREMYQKWESGRVKCPRGRYLIALEHVLGQPAEHLGFDADTSYGMDREQVLADAGLDTAMQLPEPAARYGPDSGIWLSAYEYPSSGRGAALVGRHYVMILQRGARLMVRSVPRSSSQLSMDLTLTGQVATGTWTEQTSAKGYYRGAVYHGAIQMLAEPTGRRLAGRWIGFGRNLEINDGPWTLTRVDDSIDVATLEKWNHDPAADEPAPDAG
jgi:transcriptional regulator with XRE-family HTH domain